MKAKTLTILLALLSLISFGQQWRGITNNMPDEIQVTLLSSSESSVTVSVQVPGFLLSEVVTPRGEADIVSIPNAVNIAEAGNPNLPMIPIPVVIGDKALMQVRIDQAEYVDYHDIEVAPSKGDFPRSIDPDDVPYTYSQVYQQNAFFPSQLAKLDEPYIHRDVRGQNMMVTPIMYNPVTKVLRVYKHIVLSMVKDGEDSRNIITERSNAMVLDPEFKAIYQSRYLNYEASMAKYNPIEENGELLIICHDAFMTAMEPFVNWKKQIGRPTIMVGTSETGNSASAIKTYIENYYASNPNLTDILLVGDVAQIPGVYVNAGSGYNSYSGYGDLPYGQLVGTDSYNEVIVGRFCCDNETQVTNHVNKVLNYERDLDETATWLTVGQGVSKNEGAGQGHYGEADYQHIDNIRNDLLAYNYTEVHRDYQNVSGVSANASTVSQHINEGVSIINYCNHGSETSWGVFNYSNSNVNALTNDYKLPFIISVACLNGKYDHGGNGCFAEAWMRATNNSTGNPTGAIGGMFSYISQPWTPPQYGQDEMVDILVELQSNNIRRTMGGVSINGNLRVLDLGASSNPNKGTYNCWILFGDPTLTLRNAVPTVMNVTAPTEIGSAETSYTLLATGADGALATLTRDGEIMGSAIIENGTATIDFDAPETTGTAVLTVFGYNKKTYSTSINIIPGSGPGSLYVNATATTPVIAQGGRTQLNATAIGGDGNYTYSWTPVESLDDPTSQSPTAMPDSTTVYICTVTCDDLSATSECTVTVVFPPTNFTATVLDDVNVQLNWNVANPASSYTIYRNGSVVAEDVMRTAWLDTNLEPGTYTYCVSSKYNGTLSLCSDEVVVTIEQPTPVTCPAPENFSGEYYWEDQEYGARLSWDRAEYDYTLDRFEIYRSADRVNFEMVSRIVNTPSITHYECLSPIEETGDFVYRIIAFYQNDCSSDPVDIEILITSVDESSTNDVVLYPNPTTGKVVVTSDNLKQIHIINNLGQTISQITTDENSINIDLAPFGKGLYMMLIHTDKGIVTKKIIVQ